jgi:histone demethylase JARID1
MFGLQEAKTYRPTAEQFKDPLQYIQSIREEGQKYGIIKIIPPDTWNPAFAVDTEVSCIQRHAPGRFRQAREARSLC